MQRENNANTKINSTLHVTQQWQSIIGEKLWLFHRVSWILILPGSTSDIGASIFPDLGLNEPI